MTAAAAFDGFPPATTSRVHLLRHRWLAAGLRLDAGPRGIARDAALGHARATWAACGPLNAWLDRHVHVDAPAATRR
jgi:hypothetical protein